MWTHTLSFWISILSLIISSSVALSVVSSPISLGWHGNSLLCAPRALYAYFCCGKLFTRISGVGSFQKETFEDLGHILFFFLSLGLSQYLALLLVFFIGLWDEWLNKWTTLGPQEAENKGSSTPGDFDELVLALGTQTSVYYVGLWQLLLPLLPGLLMSLSQSCITGESLQSFE